MQTQLKNRSKRSSPEIKAEKASMKPGPSTFDDAYFRMLAEAIPQIVWTADAFGHIDYLNERWFTHTGKSGHGMTDETSVLSPEDMSAFKARWERALEEGSPFEAEARFLFAKDGSYRWHLVRGVPIRHPSGRIIKWVGTYTDIHDRKMAQEQLEQEVEKRTKQLQILRMKDRAHMQRMREIIEVMPYAAIAFDQKGIVLHKNIRFRTTFGFDDYPTLIGRESIEIIAHAKRRFQKPDEDERQMIKLIASRQQHYDSEFALVDGTILSGDFIPIFESTKYRGHLLVFRDVTRERRSNRVKTEFMSLASHQLRTPLTTIRWALSRLIEGLSEEQKPLALVAKHASEHMAETIRTMLSIASFESKSVHLSFAPVLLRPLLQHLKEDVEEELKRHGVELHIDCADTFVIYTDGKLLSEAAFNLYANAIHYSPKGSAIRVSARQEEEVTIIEVRDHGIGIPEKEQHKIFSKFFRATNAAEKITDGTGLGLYLTAHIAKALSGSVDFTSKVGEGTTFRILLPRVK